MSEIVTAARLGDWIQTFTGRQFWPLDPRPDEIEIADIAHALAHQCRYGGHIRQFYSVAEHCVLMAHAVAPEHRLAALMHDAAEGYLVDLPRPIKRAMPHYRAAETAIWLAICVRYGIAPELPAEVHEADNRILVDEREQGMAPPPAPWDACEQVEPLGVKLQFWRPTEAEFQFRTLFDRLIARQPVGAGVVAAGRGAR
ncbi:phosphohydrolase [Bosea sp. (in: a-proteobacteria)]|uniref:phosphohydrolase n=1 Tax=Bosea sp. (in: a-proteobacteria) TaxID=1871050 RepID=UPI003B3A3AED